MPELVQESTSPPEVAIPPIVDPACFEDFPVLRETFLLYVPDLKANASLRGAADLLFDLILEYWGKWPNHPEGFLRASLRAAVADLRCIQGFLSEPEEGTQDTPHEEHLVAVGGEISRGIGVLADRLERELGSWRG